MVFDIVPHVRVTGLTPKDEVLPKRTKSVGNLAASFRKLPADRQLSLASEVVALFASGCKPMSEDLKNEVFSALRKGAPTYMPEKNANLELGGYCLLAAVSAVANAEDAAIQAVVPLAAGIFSGAGFLSPLKDGKLEALRKEAVQRCGDVLHARSEVARRRWPAPLGSQPRSTAEEDPLTFANRAAGALQQSIANIAANERMDREEIDLLWWALNGRSAIASGRIAELTPALAAVSAGLEVAVALTAGPAGDAHRALAERSVSDAEAGLTLTQVVMACGEQSSRIRSVFSAAVGTINQHPRLFPLLYALAGDVGEAKTRLSAAGIDAGRKHSVRTWCHRALEEGDLVRQAGQSLTLPPATRA